MIKGFTFTTSIYAIANAAIAADQKKWIAWLFWILVGSIAAAAFLQQID